ncbi:DNRLRE domain-containing protein [Clostridium ljungdahlii]|nr:DNRLRE domain-containing protein [Clostridium ljungdahlii]
MIIAADKSLTVTNKLPKENINSDYIKIGYYHKFKYISYLSFDISNIPSNAKILNAELILFKTNNFYEGNNKKLIIYQLKDYFSSYTTYDNRPKIKKDIKETFCPFTSKVYVAVDITKFVLLWAKSKSICTGIMLTSKSDCLLSSFASSKNDDSYNYPFIKLKYKTYCKNCCSEKVTIREVNVKGTVSPESKYEAVVDVQVKRHKSNDIENYYITDEYDNSSGIKPLHIDKNYKVVIIPKERKGDTEEVHLYGSYKEDKKM